MTWEPGNIGKQTITITWEPGSIEKPLAVYEAGLRRFFPGNDNPGFAGHAHF